MVENYFSNDRWTKNGNTQSPRSSDWGGRNQSNHDDKMRTKNLKDVENEQRQRDSNRHDGEDRLHQKETQNNNFFNRSEPGSRQGRGNRFSSREDNRSVNKDDSWSDRDSDTSSRGSGKRGSKGPRGIKGREERPGRRGGDRKQNSGKWSDGGDSDRSSQKSL